MKLHVESASPSKSGKSINVKAGGKYYLAKPDSNIQSAVGKTIDAETTESEYNGATLIWINEWAVVPEDKPDPKQPGPPQPTGNNIAPWWSAFMSNVCAHAIQTGLIKDPAELSKWAEAAADAAVKAQDNAIAF